MKISRLILIAASGLVLFSCTSEVADFNNALDADRDAREKMRTAIAKLEEYEDIEEGDSEELKALREADLNEASNAYEVAIDSWKNAKALYEKLMDLPGVNPDYLNNYANMLYYQYRMGFEIDLKPAEKAMERAIELEDRVLYRRNLELLRKVDGDTGLAEIRDENARLLNHIR